MSVTLVDTLQLSQSAHASTCHSVVVYALSSESHVTSFPSSNTIHIYFLFFFHTYNNNHFVYRNFFTSIKHNYYFFKDNTARGTKLH